MQSWARVAMPMLILLASLCAYPAVRAGDVPNPSQEQLNKGDELIAALKKLISIDSITPQALQQIFGFEMVMTRYSAPDERGKKSSEYWYSLRKSFPYLAACDAYYCYIVRQGYEMANGIRMSLSINEEEVCLSRREMLSVLGKPQKVTIGTMRHFLLGQIPPPGILPNQEGHVYMSKQGIALTIQYDYYTCATGVEVSEPHDPDWIFQVEDSTKIPASR